MSPGFTSMNSTDLLDTRAQSVGHVPAVAVTAYSRDEDRRQALDAGFQAHLGKPFEPERIVEAVSRLAGKTSKV